MPRLTVICFFVGGNGTRVIGPGERERSVRRESSIRRPQYFEARVRCRRRTVHGLRARASTLYFDLRRLSTNESVANRATLTGTAMA
jgi:hypothetical protein